MSVQEQLFKIQALVDTQASGDEKAHGELLKAIRELQVQVETPVETASRLNFQIVQNICIRIALEYGFFQVIVARDGEPIKASEIANETGAEILLVVRVLRVLTAVGLCEQVSSESYAANDNTRFQILPGCIGAIKHHFDLDFAMGGRLVDYMRGPGIQQFADDPDAVTLFKYAHGTDVIFGLLEKHPEQKKSFDDYMAARRVEGMPQWFDIYPAAEKFTNAHERDATLLADVGGGPGQELIRFKERYPDIPGRLVLQDLPVTLKRIDRLPDGIQAMEYDFFTPQPIKGARAYFLRNVLHNWSDAKSAQILSRIKEAMDLEYSTLLIDDYVLPDMGAELRAAEMDILMWLHTGGLERTVSQWKNLFEMVGLELIKIWSSAQGQESVLEVRVKI